MKSKTKTKSKVKKTGSRARTVRGAKVKYYNSGQLFWLIALVLLVELAAVGPFTAQEWSSGLQVLDVSASVGQTQQALVTLAAPMFATAEDVQEFYILAAIETETILSMDITAPPREVYAATNDFYALASIEMQKFLDFSNQLVFSGKVAGAATE